MVKGITIAFYITNFIEEYTRVLLRGALDASNELDIKLIVIQMEAFNCPFEYRYQSNLLFEFARAETISGVIIASGLICNYISQDDLNAKIKQAESIPLVSVSVPLENCFSILIDNRKGMFEAVEHLIKVHNRKKIAFVKGPENNFEANERFLGYLQALEANNIKIEEEIIFRGDFLKESGKKIGDLILERDIENIDAIACADDNLAIGIADKLKQSGKRIPEDVLIVGFDDTIEARAHFPRIATVRQPIYREGYLAVKTIYDIILKRCPKTGNIVLPVRFIAGASCGCSEERYIIEETVFDREKFFKSVEELLNVEEISPVITEDILYFLDYLISILTQNEISKENEIRAYSILENLLFKFQDNLSIASFFVNILDILKGFFLHCELFIEKLKVYILKLDGLYKEIIFKKSESFDTGIKNIIGRISSSINLEEWLRKLANSLRDFDINSFYILRFDSPIIHHKNEDFNGYEKIKLIFGYDRERALLITTVAGLSIKYKDWIPYILFSENIRYYGVFLIYYMDYIYGYLVVELKFPEIVCMENFARAIGQSFFTLFILESLLREISETRIRNEQLESEIAIAELLQKNILPSNVSDEKVAFYIKFAERVGGDFFDFIQFREKEWFGVVIADVSGHGVPTALITSVIKTSILQLRSLLVNPSMFLSHLNDTLYSMSKEGFFVTMFYGIIKRDEEKLVYSVAGHNLPYIIKCGEAFQVPSCYTSMPLGVLTNQELTLQGKGYKTEEFSLKEVKKLILYTDGFIETTSLKNPYATFETFFVKSLCKDYCDLKAEEFIDRVKEKLISFRGSEDFEDDITLICIDL